VVRVRLTVAAAILIAGAPARAAAQSGPEPIPPRPALEAGADTNSAGAYYGSGMEWVIRNPRRAANAFHWATVLEPAAAEAYYARWVALLLTQPRRLVGYFDGDESVLRSAETRSADSILRYGLSIDPFLYRGLQDELFTSVVGRLLKENNPRLLDVDLQYRITEYIRTDADPYVKAMVAYGSRNFPRALEQLGLALKRSKSRASVHTERGRIFHHLGQYDSAAAEITAALDELRRRDTTEMVLTYESKALLEFSAGLIREAQGDRGGAYEAYLRSAAEDLGFHPAHLRLAAMALERGDTATALSEVGIAIDTRPDDVGLRVSGSLLLIAAGHAPDAVPHLLRARELNPYYATPHFLLARLYDVSGIPRDAIEYYQTFLAHAGQLDQRVAGARERLAVQAEAGAAK
jgi:tetratricopeptide (TPR) repeat protein